MNGQRVSDAHQWAINNEDMIRHPESNFDLARAAFEAGQISARAEIARLTAERDEEQGLAEAYFQQGMARLRAADAVLADLQSRYDALLAERAGVSEAMVDKLASKINSFLQRNEHSGDLEPKIGKNLRAALEAALATPIPTPVDREAIRAEAFEEAAKIADAKVKHWRDQAAYDLERHNGESFGEMRMVSDHLDLLAAAIRSAAKTEASR